MSLAIILPFFFILYFGTLFFLIMKLRNKDEEIQSTLQRYEERQFKIAESNVNLYELHEKTEQQKLAMVEANLTLFETNELISAQKKELEAVNQTLKEQNAIIETQKMKMAEASLQLLEQKELIEKERDRSEKLLLNILPKKIAYELKEHGSTKPESFDNVTVFFSDIVNFTQKSSQISPDVLICELNDIFTAFDRIIAQYQCERVKTIGDAYLCVCGMPHANERHAQNIVQASIEMLAFIRERNQQAAHQWEIRVGIHSGSVVGGVVGVEKYIYDVFGDTINTASRMEVHSSPMKVNLSEVTYQKVRDDFSCTKRKPMQVKGKGEVTMYYLDVPELADV